MARKAVPHDRYRLIGTYERLRKTLVDLPPDGRLDKPLSFWVRQTDRRLPIAFLDRPLGELLDEDFDKLLSTPGIGQKKIQGFFDLLRRAAKSTNAQPFGLQKEVSQEAPLNPSHSLGFDPTVVSESLWLSWRETVRRNGFGNETLGRLAPTLQALPTVIWQTPLADYMDLSLAEVRQLKTHGEKRIQAILEVFCSVHEAVATAALHENLELQLLPRFIPPLTRWILDISRREELPTADEVEQHLVQPLLQQVEIDLGDQVAQLAIDRLRFDNNAPSVRHQADTLGVTRARVYQLLEDCATAMEVRWPEGRWLLAALTTKLSLLSPETIGLLHVVRDLFFPEERILAARQASFAD